MLLASEIAFFSVILAAFTIVDLSGLNDCAIVRAFASVLDFNPISFAVVGAPTDFNVFIIFV